MVNLGAAKLAGVIIAISIVAIIGTNFAFGTQPCGAQAYTYIGCTPMSTAQLYGAILVGCVVAFAIVCGAAGIRHTIHNL